MSNHTTLRDGTQRTDISLSASDKLNIARRLDDLGVAFIEGGWPGSNPNDVEFFERARQTTWRRALVTALGATCRVGGGPEDDQNIKALIDSGAPVCTVVGKTWTLHVTDVLRTTLDDNLRIIEKSLAFLREKGRRVIYDAEHFFDGYPAPGTAQGFPSNTPPGRRLEQRSPIALRYTRRDRQIRAFVKY